MPALCPSPRLHSLYPARVSRHWFPMRCKALCSVAGGPLTALSLHLSGRVPSQGPPGGPQKRMMGAGARGRVWSPVWPGHISGPLSLHLPFVPAEQLQEPGLSAEFTCLRLPCLESIVSYRPLREISTAQGQKEQGVPVSLCISLLAGWGLGIMRPESGNGEAQAVSGVETRTS